MCLFCPLLFSVFWFLSSGVVRVSLADMDRETRENYTVVIQAKDMGGQLGGLAGTTTVNITLSDINDNPPMFDQSKRWTTFTSLLHSLLLFTHFCFFPDSLYSSLYLNSHHLSGLPPHTLTAEKKAKVMNSFSQQWRCQRLYYGIIYHNSEKCINELKMDGILTKPDWL